MDIYVSLLVVGLVVCGAGIFAYKVSKKRWLEKILEIVIGTATTFAGVFLGIGLDNMTKSRDEREYAGTKLDSYMIEYVEEMRPWFADAGHFRGLALPNIDSEQRVLMYENFKDYISQSKLEIPPPLVATLDTQSEKQLDHTFLELTNHNEAKIKTAYRIFNGDKEDIGRRYDAYSFIILTSADKYVYSCLQIIVLRNELDRKQLNSYVEGKMPQDKIRELNCAPPWGVGNLVNRFLEEAKKAR
jgi:hypothetical protein